MPPPMTKAIISFSLLAAALVPAPPSLLLLLLLLLSARRRALVLAGAVPCPDASRSSPNRRSVDMFIEVEGMLGWRVPACAGTRGHACDEQDVHFFSGLVISGFQHQGSLAGCLSNTSPHHQPGTW